LASSDNFDSTPMESGPDEFQPDDPPPFLKTWPRVYRAVIVYLVLLIFALYLVTRAFAPHSGL
jgi:hypothetical protein